MWILTFATMGLFAYAGLIVSAAVFILLAHYWYKANWINSLKIFAVAFVIDLIIMYIIMTVLFAAFFSAFIP